MPDGSSAPARDWLSLGPASRLIGVNPATLRRWADDGRVVAFTTVGGHRRFERRSLERVVTARRAPVGHPFARLRATPAGFSKAYRRSYRSSAPQASASAAATDRDREAYRQDGRRLVEALVTYLEAPHGDLAPTVGATREAAESMAARLTAEFAARLAAAGVSLTDAVESFTAARRPFLAELGQLAARRGLEPAGFSALYEDASALLDRLLLRFIATHQARGDASKGR